MCIRLNILIVKTILYPLFEEIRVIAQINVAGGFKKIILHEKMAKV